MTPRLRNQPEARPHAMADAATGCVVLGGLLVLAGMVGLVAVLTRPLFAFIAFSLAGAFVGISVFHYLTWGRVLQREHEEFKEQERSQLAGRSTD